MIVKIIQAVRPMQCTNECCNASIPKGVPIVQILNEGRTPRSVCVVCGRHHLEAVRREVVDALAILSGPEATKEYLAIIRSPKAAAEQKAG